MSIAKNTDGSLSITNATGNYGAGYNATIALTLDLSKLGTLTSNQLVFRLGDYWGMEVEKGGDATYTFASKWPSYADEGKAIVSSSSSSGLLTLVMTMSESGTKLMDSNLKAGGTDTGMKGSAAGNFSTITIGSYAADALVGIAAWGRYGSGAYAANAYNSLAGKVNGALATPSAWQEQAFVSQRTDGSASLGRVTFIGDSITEGINDQTWRYQLFKNLVDNGIEYEIAGLREGYDSKFLPANPETEYGGVDFVNRHLGKSSGKTYSLINNGTKIDSVSGVANVTSSDTPYGYTIADAAALNSNTYIMLMGTNDLLSDTATNAGTAAYAAVMQNLLGGTVQYENGNYRWTAGDGTGNMGTLLDTLKLAEANDTVYLMTIPTWSNVNRSHGNDDESREAVKQYNGLLGQWVEAYNANNTGANVKLIDINDGLVDVTKGKFEGVQSFFKATNGDGLHPNKQGSLIMASNLAHGMGLAGRTAGQARLAASALGQQAGDVTVSGSSAYAADFSFEGGAAYTISLDAVFGNGAEGGWSATDVLSIYSGNGSVSGTLNISEGYISWGQDILFSRDMSQNSETIRIAYITGDKDKANLAEGYYVWLNDKLIGEGLQATQSSYNGLSITSTLETTVQNLAYGNGSYAPETDMRTNCGTEHAYTVKNPVNPNPSFAPDMTIDNGGDFTSASVITSNHAVTANGGSDTPLTVTTSTDTTSWYAGMDGHNLSYTGDIAMEIKGAGACAFGVVSSEIGGLRSTTDGNVTMVMNSPNANIGLFSSSISVVGTYNGSITGTFKFVVNQGSIQHGIVGGAWLTNNPGSIGATNIIINGGTVGGSIYGGSGSGFNATAELVKGDACVQITGGTIGKSVYGGGMSGKICGDTHVEIAGGEIKGDVFGGNSAAGAVIAGTKNVTIRGGIIHGNVSGGSVGETNAGNVTIVGNNARISGTVSADHVTLQNVADSGKDSGFDTYANTISARQLTLENVTVESLAASFAHVSTLEALGSTNTNMVLGDEVTLTNLKLADGTSLGIYKAGEAQTASTANEVTVTVTDTLDAGAGATLNANLVFSAGSTMHLDGTLTMGSSVRFVDGMRLEGALLNTLYGSGTATLYDSVDEFYVNGIQWNDGDSWTGDEGSAAVQALFANLVSQNSMGNEYQYGLSYTGGNIVLTASVPEPATATLSLLALAALAARRRRK